MAAVTRRCCALGGGGECDGPRRCRPPARCDEDEDEDEDEEKAAARRALLIDR